MNIEWCTFLGKKGKRGVITLKPLGVAKNSVKKPSLSGWGDLVTNIVIKKKYERGLDGMEDYSHIIVLYWLDQEKECHLKHHPQGKTDVPYIGIFACRCPQRPNPIGMSTVPLISRRGNVLKVKGLDILNGTPILAVKPYWPVYDKVEKATIPLWVNKLVF